MYDPNKPVHPLHNPPSHEKWKNMTEEEKKEYDNLSAEYLSPDEYDSAQY